jgi:asparagine synthase (glutamine-hydrolysing)
MTGLAAHVAFAGGPPDHACVAAMLAAMPHRGPITERAAADAAVVATRGRAEGRLARPRGGGAMLAGDLRLDDPEALAETLALPRDAAPAVLARAAYARWGLGFAERLEGEFALVVWDPARRRLVGARDRFGVKPFYYSADARGLAAASELASLLAGLPGRPDPDPAWIADYLTGHPSDAAATAYRDVRRLEPGSLLVAEADGAVETRAYWTLEPEEAGRDEGALHDLLAGAVARRVRGATAGAMLSGGLDSSAIAILASRAEPDRDVPAYTLAIRDAPGVDESAHVASVLGAGRFEARRVEAVAPDWGDAGRAALGEQGAPLPAPGLLVTRALYEAAARRGTPVLLNGHGGDEVISDGFARLPQLAAAGDWPALWRASGAAAALYGQGRTDVLLASLAAGAGSRTVRGLAGRLRAGPDPRAWRRIVSPEAARRTALVERRRAGLSALASDPDPARRAHRTALAPPRVAGAFETLDRAASAHGVEPRYPFFDPRIAAHCLARPASEKLADGRTRALLREAMRGVLPERVRLRPDKADFLPVAVSGLRGPRSRALLEALAADPAPIAGHVCVETLRAHVRALRAGALDGPTTMELWRVSQLALWLGADGADASTAQPRRVAGLAGAAP